MLTGFELDVLQTLLVYLTKKVEYGRSCTKEELYDQILLTIIKLSYNLSYIIQFWKWVDLMHDRGHICKTILLSLHNP